VAFDTVEIKVGGDAVSAARAVCETGEVVYAWNLQVEAAVISQIEQGGRCDLIATGSTGIERLIVNFANPDAALGDKRSEPDQPHPILSDPKVRQALSLAIDRKSMAEQVWGIGGKVTCNILTQPADVNSPNTTCDQDVEKAKQLLDEAGWKLDGDVRRKDGRPLELSIVIPAGVAASRQESELMQNMLGRIGVSLRINVVPVADFFDKYVRVGQFDMTVFSWIGTPFPISSGKSIYAKPTVNSSGGLDIQQNYGRVGSDEIDALYDQATAELDRAKAIEIANMIDTLIWQEVHSLTLYQRPELWACKVGLANIGAFGFAAAVYEDIGWAKR
jgi:peptide/nickel transport system substrate-binding protein